MLGREIDSNSVILVAVTVCRAVLVISSALRVLPSKRQLMQ